MIERNDYSEYIRRFNKRFSIIESGLDIDEEHFDIDDSSLHNREKEIAEVLIQSMGDDSTPCGVFVTYGFRLGAVLLQGKCEPLTRQEGYKDTAIYPFSVDDRLNFYTDEGEREKKSEQQNQDESNSNLISWVINPQSNVEVFDDVLSSMILPMVKNVVRALPPGIPPFVSIIIPPVSQDLAFPDWKSFFSRIHSGEMKVKVLDYGALSSVTNGKRTYQFLYQSDGYKEYLILSAYEIIRGHRACLGSMAFDIIAGNIEYTLQSPTQETFECHSETVNFAKKEHNVIVEGWDYLQPQLPFDNGCNSFLGNNAITFLRESYYVAHCPVNMSANIQKIVNLFCGEQPLQVFELCARMLNEDNLFNISLNDMVFIANILQKNSQIFHPVSLKTGKKNLLGTDSTNHFLPIDNKKIAFIPANYGSILWKLKDRRKKLVPYGNLNPQKHLYCQIVDSIVDHYDYCTTENVAEDLLYLYKHTLADPSAYYAAKVFMDLSRIDSVKIDGKNEYV